MATASSHRFRILFLVLLAGTAAVTLFVRNQPSERGSAAARPGLRYQPARPVDSAGFTSVASRIAPWPAEATLQDIASRWKDAGRQLLEIQNSELDWESLSVRPRVFAMLAKASMLNYEGEPERAYEVLEEARRRIEEDDDVAEEWLFTVIAFQGVTALRRGETENCVMCRGESSCILPIASAAFHQKPIGSRLAIKHFTEYLDQFPDDLENRWLLNIAHMTLGEYPEKVDPRFRLSLDRFNSPEHAIGKFRDVGHLVGINRFNQAGGAILDDFDNDDNLDIVMTSFDPGLSMAFFRNSGDGTFEDRSRLAGVQEQLGGLNCVQGDFDNDGFTDIFIPCGAWLKSPIRPSLMRNNGNGTFTDVTREAGLLHAMNSNAAQWADFDNDGYLDLFVCNETGPCRLYRNTGGGRFVDVAPKAGVDVSGAMWKGATWVDYDADGYPDLFVNNLTGTARLYHNSGNGTFTDATSGMGINGPEIGFSCWNFDFDNDGWPDIFATSYDRSLKASFRG